MIIPDDDPGTDSQDYVVECKTAAITPCTAVIVGQPITTFHDLIRQDVRRPFRGAAIALPKEFWAAGGAPMARELSQSGQKQLAGRRDMLGADYSSHPSTVVPVNDELCRILGYERNELLQKTWAEMTHPDDRAADTAQFNRGLAGEIDFSIHLSGRPLF